MLLTMILLWLWLELAIIGADTSKPMASWRRTIMRGPIKAASRTLMLLTGFVWVRKLESAREYPRERGSLAPSLSGHSSCTGVRDLH